ncbi:ABC transporter ATP-binding protein [Roseiconus lacunae]|uniref:ABC transporter ATP-binding protein n=1 Tax=Roseiconus lacunae TaxID=2605694 RepID=A0ABT7PI86_9BACT|nr:ABC transporter ATP-binding protein [Roseiconus lacunae]MCD0458324.1 ABC transporter ATP-binding protein [Roseiconus lacunae]MDM4016214.1 ABC transporter ATP-binding protein [Roseiconus lacunae]WRQ52183.1 ABC transporter ATP-binding protein [Stieleria sp. HD01]
MIKTVDLTKKYGDAFAIKSIDLDLQPGDLFGFIGPNGAGKTTTMRIIATLLEPTHGEAYVCDHSVHTAPKEIRRLVGYMPDFFGVYDDMTVVEYLEFFAAAYRINGQDRKNRVDEMLEIVDLDFKRDAFANTLSRGQTQRLGLARTLLHDPQVLLLDEPLSGLDPRARIEMRNLLRKLGEMGKTIIVSSHILPELADVCNKVGIIDRGELKQNAEVTEVIRMVREHTVLVVTPNRPDEMQRIIDQLIGHHKVQDCEPGDASVRVVLKPDVDDYSDLPQLLIENGIALRGFTEEELDLESAFMALTKGTSTRM